jgi:hypothetical protein
LLLCYFATFYFHTVLLGALIAESEVSWILSWLSWFESVAKANGKKCCGLLAVVVSPPNTRENALQETPHGGQQEVSSFF